MVDSNGIETGMTASPLSDLTHALQPHFSGDIRLDPVTRLLYSTDASLYQVEPLGVAFPRSLDDLNAAVETCSAYGVPVIARGAGSGLAGQAIGPALILDCSRWLKHIVSIDPEACTAVVEPGVVVNALNQAAARYGLQWGPDPASAERATLGGSLANNAAGAHSIVYGMAADHLLAAQVVLSDGSLAELQPVPWSAVHQKASAAPAGQPQSRESALYGAALAIRQQYQKQIIAHWPRTWRRASGYSLNYLLPWSSTAPPMWQASGASYPTVPPGMLNLAPLLAGSEGTLAVIRQATVKLVTLPRATVLGVLSYPDIPSACDAVPALLACQPTAIELIPPELIRLARSVPAYSHQLRVLEALLASYQAPQRSTSVSGDAESLPVLLIVEFAGPLLAPLLQQVRSLRPDVFVAEQPAVQRQLWAVRKVGLGILTSAPGEPKPVAFIEDLAVPVDRLGEFAREMERILGEHGTKGDVYAHASAGCLHIRPLLNLKTLRGVQQLRSIAGQAVQLTLRLGGSVSGEHGDGLARSEWLEQMYGADIIEAFKRLKRAADPQEILNPGKIVSISDRYPLSPMDSHLRYAGRVNPDDQPRLWQTALNFTRQAGLAAAIDQCNGAGVCRKSEGVMCPSFQATQEEMCGTRGRANLLRAMLAGHFPDLKLAEKAVYQALDLCLACKGCGAECPSGVDMARLKYEFMHQYYRRHRRRLRDYLFGYIGSLARWAHFLAPVLNPFLSQQFSRVLLPRFMENTLGLAHQRPFPAFSLRSLQSQAGSLAKGGRTGKTSDGLPANERVLFLSDAFTEFFYPAAGLAALRTLDRAGCAIQVLPVLGAGRTLISKGFIEPARRHLLRLLDTINELDPDGSLAVVGIEPSEIYTLRDEFADLMPADDPARQRQAEAIGQRAWMIDEFLLRPGRDGRERLLRVAGDASAGGPPAIGAGKKVLLHGHCYQKARPPAADGYPTGVAATQTMLSRVGYSVELIDSGCCGMAGAFGYEAEHYALSQQVAELALLPALRRAGEAVILAASGVSCQSQIQDGVHRPAVHPVLLLAA